LIERLEPLLSNGRSTEFLASPDHMRVMQGIDLAVQKTHGLADFLDGISERLEPDHLIDITTALNVITLEDMKRRLMRLDPRGAVISRDLPEGIGRPGFF
jgi:ABC-type Zn uptake system ZnuABC Zn-binding protein ZnuA